MKNFATSLLLVFLMLLPLFSAKAQNGLSSAFKESYVLEQQNNFRGAAEKLKALYQADSYEVNLRLGWLYYQAGQLPESAEYYKKAAALKPYAIEPRLGWVLPLSAQGRWNEVAALYTSILETDPQNTLVNYRLGLLYYNRGQYEKADPYLEKVVNLYPFDHDGLLLLAWNKLKLQKSREARVLFQKVLLNTPDDASALEGLNLLK